MKPSFLNHDKPLVCGMVQPKTPELAKAKIRASIAMGANALGIQLCSLQREYRTPEILKDIFKECGDRPIYVTSYPWGANTGLSDEECAELLLLAIDCGATLADIYGYMFERGAKWELATSPEAVAKQKALADEIHKRGGEVLISSHTQANLTPEENIYIAREHIARGADVIKIVDIAASKSDIPSYIESIQKIVGMTDKKLLLLASGEGGEVRYFGPHFGVFMYLALAYYDDNDQPLQPLISEALAVRDTIR